MIPPSRAVLEPGFAPGSAPRALVVGVEGSARSSDATTWAVAEARSRGGSVRLVQVIDPVPADLGVSPPVRTAVAEGHPALPHPSDRTRAGALSVLLAYGAPAAALLDAACDADLVVIGRGRGGAGAAPMLGATARRVVGESNVPVVVVPPGWSPAEHVAGPVVVQFDLEVAGGEGAADGAAALDLAFQRARELDVPLVAIAAWRSLGLHGLSLREVRSVLRARRRLVAAHLDPWRRRFSEVRLSALLPIADTAAMILRLSYGAQLAVVGRQNQRGRGHPAWSDLDTASRGSIHAAACPVLVVPDHWSR